MIRFLFLLLVVPAVGLAQPTPRFETFLEHSDSLAYRMETVMVSSGEDPDTREKMNMRAGSDFTFILRNARLENDTIFAESSIESVRTTVDMDESAPADAPRDTTIEGWEYSGRKAIAAFSKSGKLYSLRPAEYSDDDFEISLSRFQDMVKMAFTRYDEAERPHSAGDRWKAIQIDTEYVYDMPIITKSFYEMSWRGVVDTLGSQASKYEFVVDSVQMAESQFGVSFPERGTYGVQLYDPREPMRRLWYSHITARSELDLSFGMEAEEEPKKGKKGKAKKGETKKAPKPKPIMHMNLTVKASLLNK